MTEAKDLDVTRIPPQMRHFTIFNTFNELKAGESFIIRNNHDPVPLRNQFNSVFPNQFQWEYLQTGPDIWRVRLGKLT